MIPGNFARYVTLIIKYAGNADHSEYIYKYRTIKYSPLKKMTKPHFECAKPRFG